MTDTQDAVPDQNAEQPAEETRSETGESSPLRQVSKEELKRILEAHRRWVASKNYQEWLKASFSRKQEYEEGRADLARTHLHKASLSKEDLRGANLQGSYLN